MDPLLQDMFNEYQAQLGKLFGQSLNVYRPPLGVTVDQTPALVLPNVQIKVEKGRSDLAQPGIHNIEYYSIFGDYTQIQAGDILVPEDPTSNTPDVTFISKSPGEEAKGVRTSRTCNLITNFSPADGSTNTIYSNVRFEFLPTGFPSNQFADLVLGRGSVPTISAIIYSLPNMQQVNVTAYDIAGVKLIDVSGVQPVTYTVKLVEEITPILHMVLQQE